ncbi:MAG: hypothetical protein KBT15_04210 [Bacteroidales bacterium]|nr:hypothetical protein [Candidatus Minthousia equi]
MNKKLFTLLSGVAIITSASLQSCADEFDPQVVTKLDQIGIDYTESFVSRFGTPDPNQKWGMDEVLQPIGALAKAKTRDGGTAGTVWTNRNQWVERKDADTSPIFADKEYKDDALAHDIQVPGWPHLNGLYYGNNGENALTKTWNKTNEIEGDALQAGSALPNGAQPCGDVTEYEIQYVSAFFRTHTKAEMAQYEVKLHLTDFFIQNVSGDNDQISYGSLDNSKGPQTGYNGKNITSWEDDQSIPEDKRNVTRDGGNHEAINYKLEQLSFKTMGGDWTHVNNFNSQNTNFNPEESNENNYREIKYVTSSGTEDFECQASFSSELVRNYVLVRLTWHETVQNRTSPYYGKTIAREGYYLAFDFQAYNKANIEVKPDGYYSNWIVKITPGHFNPDGNARRVMCEDLGGTYDFDFNDAVFDVAFDGDEVIVAVQAAGGTMPIYIGKNEPDYEVHKLLEGEVSTPINAQYSHTHAPAIYRVPKGSITTVSEVTVTVHNTGLNKDYPINGGPDERVNLNPDTDATNPYGSPTDKRGTVAPRAFAVPTHVKWMMEEQWIDNTYMHFKDWVTDKDAEFDNPDPEVPSKVKWYDAEIKNIDKLFYADAEHSMKDGSPTGEGSLPANWVALTPAGRNLTAVGAVSSLQLKGYTEGDPIWKKLNDVQHYHQVTFTIVLKSTHKFTGDELQALVIPADYITSAPEGHTDATMYYKGNYFSSTSIQSSTDWKTGSEGEYENNGTTYYTYTSKFTFTKEQLMTDKLGTETTDYCDDIYLFVKKNTSDAVTAEWHIHY